MADNPRQYNDEQRAGVLQGRKMYLQEYLEAAPVQHRYR
jgi:hypothetical protein